MEHIYTLLSLDPEICLVPHQQLDQFNPAVEAGKVQRVEALVRPRRRIDPIGYFLTNLLLYPRYGLSVKVLWIRLPLTLALLLLQVLAETLLVVVYQECSTLRGIVISSSGQ